MRTIVPLLLAAAAARAGAPVPPPAPAPAAPAPSSIAGLQPLAGNPNLLGLGLPAASAETARTVQRWNNARAAVPLDLLPDGSAVLVATRFGSTAQLHLVEQPLGMRTQLTFGDEPVGAARFLPQDPNTIVYLQDVGGGEFYQLFKLDRRTLKTELLTDGKSRHEGLVVSREGRKLAWSSTARNGKDTDVYVADAAALKEPKRLTELEGSWRALDFSPAGRQLLVVQERSIQDADLWLYDLEKNERRQLTPKEGKASVRGAAFTADGRGVYLATDRWSDFNELVRLDAAKPEAPPQLLTRAIPWSVESFAVPHDPGAPAQVAVSINQDGYSRLYLVEPGTGALSPIALPGTILGSLRFASRKGDRLALSLESARAPRDAWMLDVRTKHFVRWTRSELGPIDAAALVEPQLVRVPAPGGGVVPTFVLRPKDAPAGKRPALVIWHGGPEGQHRPLFSPAIQLLVAELGLVVALPNPRGSDGYGKAFLAADDGVKREASLQDAGAVLDWLAAQPDVDPARLGVQGGSYGGYLTLATAAFFPDKVRAAIDVVGISSLTTFLANTQAYRRDLRRAEYGDERDPKVREVLERISPLGSAGRIKAALFVQQGKNDPRVPQSEAEQLVAALRAAGRDPWYLLALNEGHGFAKKENRDAASAAVLEFLRERLIK